MKHEKRSPQHQAALAEHIKRTDALFAKYKAKELSYYDYTAACNASFLEMKASAALEPSS
jgi:hypothetical protein